MPVTRQLVHYGGEIFEVLRVVNFPNRKHYHLRSGDLYVVVDDTEQPILPYTPKDDPTNLDAAEENVFEIVTRMVERSNQLNDAVLQQFLLELDGQLSYVFNHLYATRE